MRKRNEFKSERRAGGEKRGRENKGKKRNKFVIGKKSRLRKEKKEKEGEKKA